MVVAIAAHDTRTGREIVRDNRANLTSFLDSQIVLNMSIPTSLIYLDSRF